MELNSWTAEQALKEAGEANPGHGRITLGTWRKHVRT